MENNPTKNTYIDRDLETIISPYLNRKEVIAIVGPRQSGKTTLLEHLKENMEKNGKNVRYLTLERPSDLELFNDIEDFRAIYGKTEILIIDEFQYANQGGQKLKYLFDTTNTKYIVSGSSSPELKFQTGKYMVGRMLQFTLLPLSFREYLSWKEPELKKLLSKNAPSLLEFQTTNALGSALHERLGKYFEEYLIFGAYPAVVLTDSKEEKQKIMESILGNYLLREIRSLIKLTTEEELVRLAKFLATQIGNLVQYQELSRVSGLSYREVRKHIEILRQTYLVELLRPYFTNKRTELTKNPKVYFLDSGFRNLLLSDFRSLVQRGDMGNLVENYVFTRLKYHATGFRNLNFWRTKSGAEMDFVLQEGGELIPIEVKYKAGKNPALGKSFYSFLEKFSPKRAFVVTKGEAAKKKVQSTEIISQVVSFSVPGILVNQSFLLRWGP